MLAFWTRCMRGIKNLYEAKHRPVEPNLHTDSTYSISRLLGSRTAFVGGRSCFGCWVQQQHFRVFSCTYLLVLLISRLTCEWLIPCRDLDVRSMQQQSARHLLTPRASCSVALVHGPPADIAPLYPSRPSGYKDSSTNFPFHVATISRCPVLETL